MDVLKVILGLACVVLVPLLIIGSVVLYVLDRIVNTSTLRELRIDLAEATRRIQKAHGQPNSKLAEAYHHRVCAYKTLIGHLSKPDEEMKTIAEAMRDCELVMKLDLECGTSGVYHGSDVRYGNITSQYEDLRLYQSNAAARAEAAEKERKGPWGYVIVAAILVVAFVTNPDRASLEKTCRENMAQNRAKVGMLEKLAADALLDVSYERKDYYLFSIGTVKARVRLGGPQVDIEVFGAFGRWWFELLDTPLLEKKKK